MGVPKLAALLKSSAGPKQKISRLPGLSHDNPITIGIDISTKLVPWTKTVRGAEEYNASPAIPPNHVANQCLQYIRKMEKQNVKVIVVFDGISRTPIKQSVAGEKRNAECAKAHALLKKLIATPWPSNKAIQEKLLSDITKAHRGSAKVTSTTVATVINVLKEHDINYVVSPFEADWQLSYMFNLGLIQAIDSTDSDYWALLQKPYLLLDVNTTDLKTHHYNMNSRK
mmetsp:Transcript_36542/g.62233  ORF Transcript_36542/g.62233 Transcript_36542/m.62233 type:complete len:227 (+) Transcript_36542:262-942(+)